MGKFASNEHYFAFQEEYCDDCVHYYGCPIFASHLLYDDAGEVGADIKAVSILNMFIKTNEDSVTGLECTMHKVRSDKAEGQLSFKFDKAV